MPDALSPEWWVDRLHKQLVARQPDLRLFDDYYRGDHPAPWLASQAENEFRRLLDLTRSNYMGLVVDATVERLQVEGFRIATGATPDGDTWRIWQANNLDADSDESITDAVKRGRSFMLVAPNPDDETTPIVTVEDALQTVIEYAPGSNCRRRAAGLKLWHDDWTGLVCATLFYDGFVFKYQVQSTASDVSLGAMWERREVTGEDWPAVNPLGGVPLVELPNMTRRGQSEIYDVIPVQDRINKTLADRLMTQDFGAFPQKWATGYPTEDEAGTPTKPIDIGRDRMVTTDVVGGKFGQWDPAPLDPYSAAKSEDVNDIAARTRTPPQYLLGRMVNIPGNALAAAESGLIAKCGRRQRVFGESLEEVMRLARRAAGLPDAGAAAMETVWRDAQFRSDAEIADATVKKFQAGLISWRQAVEDLGYSDAQIKRMAADKRDEATDPTLAAVARDLRASSGAPGDA